MMADTREELTPQMRDYDRLSPVWVPYLMFLHTYNYRSRSVNTDGWGLRFNVDPDGTPFSFDDLGDRPYSLFIGGSTAFGVGTTADDQTIPARLSATQGDLWLNFGGRAFSSTQEYLLWHLYSHRMPPPRRIVIFSGVNNLILYFLSEVYPAELGGMFNFTMFRDALRRAELTKNRRMLRDFLYPFYGDRIDYANMALQDLPRYLLGMDRADPDAPLLNGRVFKRISDHHETRADALLALDRDLGHWRRVANSLQVRLDYILQPMFNWTQKPACDEEKRLFNYLDQLPHNQFRVLAQDLNEETYLWHVEKLESICTNHGIPFHDMNRLLRERAGANEWIFVDRVHLTDRGNEIVAEILMERIVTE